MHITSHHSLVVLVGLLLLAGLGCHCDKRSFDESRDSLIRLLRSKVDQSRRNAPQSFENQSKRFGSSVTRARTIPEIQVDVDSVPPPPILPEGVQTLTQDNRDNLKDASTDLRELSLRNALPASSTTSTTSLPRMETSPAAFHRSTPSSPAPLTTSSTTPSSVPQASFLESSNDDPSSNDNQMPSKAFLEFLAYKMATNSKSSWPQAPAQPPETLNDDSKESIDYDSLTLEDIEHILQLEHQLSSTTSTTMMPLDYRGKPAATSTRSEPFSHQARYDMSTSKSRINQSFKQVTKGQSPSTTRLTTPGDDDQECGGSVMITTYVDIVSPNYPSRYPPNTDCRWEISAPNNQILRVKIIKLIIEHDKDCRFDYLDIKGVPTFDKQTSRIIKQTKRYCGNYLNEEEIVIGSNYTEIVFHSDISNQLQGFFLTVTAETINECTHDLNILNTTYISSPKYPELYDNSENCWTQLSTQANHRMLLNFEDLKLEGGAQCESDYVEVFDSDQHDPERSMGKFCQLPPNGSLLLKSSGQHMLFHFFTDNLVAMRGYKVKINSLREDVNVSNYMSCNWDVDWQNMTIASPFYPQPYLPSTHCETSISALLPDERIIILFNRIDLVNDITTTSDGQVAPKPSTSTTTGNATKCQLDRLEIWESIEDTEPSTILCGSRTTPYKFISKGNSIRLVFKSSDDLGRNRQRQQLENEQFGNEANAGFKAKFAIISANLYNKMKTNIQNRNQTSPGSIFDSVKSTSGMTLLQEFVTIDEGGGSVAAPPPVLVRRPENASVMLGSSHILHCELRQANAKSLASSVAPTINWFKGDREVHDGVSPKGSSLLIRQFSLNSVGRYICVYGENSSDAWLSAKEDTDNCHNASVLFRVRPKDQYTSEGEFVMLHCSATLANSIGEDAEISWERLALRSDENGDNLPKPVVYDSRVRKLKRGDLLFDAAFVEDSGYYFCVVRLNESVANGERCEFKSAARVEINQRVDISQYCGRPAIARRTDPQPTKGEIGKITGGTEADMGEFPWMVMFWDDKRHVFCGGSLVNERWVVTAAHCFTDISDESTVFVKLGKYDQTLSEPTELDTKIQHIIRHPHFSNQTFDNDIALVKLSQHISFTKYILPICLPQSSEEVDMLNSLFFAYDPFGLMTSDRGYKYGWVTGWGRLKENGPMPRYLHKIRLPIVNHHKCQTSTQFPVSENMFCAGYGTEIVGDACKGDSGGPFAVIHENRWILLGVTSWGEGCGRRDKFGYYTKINNFENWIRRLTRMN